MNDSNYWKLFDKINSIFSAQWLLVILGNENVKGLKERFLFWMFLHLTNKKKNVWVFQKDSFNNEKSSLDH